MESPEYLHSSGYNRAGIPQYALEMKAGGDHFIVEDLLDFSNEEEDETSGGLLARHDAAFDGAAGNSNDSSTVTAVDSCSSSFSSSEPHFTGDPISRSFADASLSGDLCEPYDELAELEWLSNFVEESFSSEDLRKLQLISGVNSASSICAAGANRVQVPDANTARQASQPAVFLPETPVPGKARSKRSRAAPCSWSSRLLVLSQPSATSSPESELIVPPSPVVKKAAKPAKKKDTSAKSGVAPAADGRKCHHCQTDKTPQWRTGSMGPKTLCNACGVRYKSGRLVPEYRPAASPTFVLSKHSNSHRKVLELRRQKELQLQQQLNAPSAGSGLSDGTTTMAAAASDEFLIHHHHTVPDFRPAQSNG